MSDSNGSAPETQEPHMYLRLDPATHVVTIDGNVASLDMALAILQQATRYIESQWRIAQAFEAQAQAKQAAETNARVKNILDMSMKRN